MVSSSEFINAESIKAPVQGTAVTVIYQVG